MDDQDYMRQALTLAARGAGFVSPNPMVGAVVVKDDRVLGEGYHRQVGGPHAEINALEAAGPRTRDATLYVTLEPCNHTGRTPPCTQAIIESGIQRVVVAMEDPNPNVTGGGNGFLEDHGVEVICGVCKQEAQQLNESYIKYVRTKQPFVVLKMAATLDGYIATRTGNARWVTGKTARAEVHRLRHAMDGILVGIGTVHCDDPRLTTRLEIGTRADPVRFILDSTLSIKETARILNQDSKAPTYVVCKPGANRPKQQRLMDKGVRLMEIPQVDNGLDLRILLARLGDIGITSLLIEGGARVAGSALASNIIDKMILFYGPKILGSDDGFPLWRGRGPERMEDARHLQDITVSRFGQDIMIQGYLHPSESIDTGQ
jgi:diaminohydroxyphosphoribosylaminopyrimidine deaminase/5-amino-6-(5-phosphoribosylamino)uracil reductase